MQPASMDPPDWEKTNKDVARNAFEKSSSPEPPNPSLFPGSQGHGSDMVKNHKPEPKLTPKGAIRDVVDRAIHLDKVSTEKTQAEARMKDALQRMEIIDSIQQGKPVRAQEQDSSKRPEIDEEKLAKALQIAEKLNQTNRSQVQELGREMGR